MLLARLLSLTLLHCAALIISTSLLARPDPYFTIEVTDEKTGRGVPLVEVRTVHGARWVTDSAGRVAFHEPGLMDLEVFFYVEAHGYEHAADRFGYRGFQATTTPGGTARVTVRRTNLAERLYRLSGGGIYRDTVLLGLEPPMKEPLLNAKVLGQDSVVAAVYNDRIYWFWGDTSAPDYPLGNFHASGATSSLPGPAGTDPARAIEYSYFKDESGFAKEMAKMPGHGPTWLSGLSVVPDEEGRERLIAGYVKIENQLDTYARGLVVFDDDLEQFVQVADFSMEAPLAPTGHALKIEEEGVNYLYFSWSLPLVRVPAVLEQVKKATTYETFTPLRAGSLWEDREVERDESGQVVYGWKRGTPTVGPAEQATLLDEGLLSPEELLFAPRDISSGQSIRLHSGAVEWNPFRERWILIASELFGSSTLGEVWFLEADSPLGPWVYARKTVSHDDYSFYNPKHHRFLDEEGGRRIYFEGTYTKLFSGAQEATPYYDYNQILYRLDLAAPELRLPVAFYREPSGKEERCYLSARQGARGGTRPQFWALEQAGQETVAIWCSPTGAGECRLRAGTPEEARGEESILFYGLSAGTAEPPPGAMPLHQPGTDGEIVCYVWEHPMPKGPVLPIQLP